MTDTDGRYDDPLDDESPFEETILDPLGADDDEPLDADVDDELLDSADADRQAAEEGTIGGDDEMP